MKIMINRKEVYTLLRQVPSGKITTYKKLADKLKTKGYRAIGKIVGLNPDSPFVPCHRVVKSNATLGGYAFGIDKKIALLAAEGIKISDGKIVDFAKKLHSF
jgi:methylated-DNA-[protein]-cysteine S-methyltransferase